MGLFEDLHSGGYLHPAYNMVSIYDHEGQSNYNCDNYFLFTAIAKQLCAFPVWPGAYSFYNNCCVQPGLVRRHPGANDTSQQELAACTTLSLNIELDIEEYAEANGYCFNIAKPGTFSWTYFFGRFIDFPPFIQMQANQFIFFGQLLWSIGLITTTLSPYGDTSEKVYKWMQVNQVAGKRWVFCNLAVYVWIFLMQRKYPGGTRELFSVYFPKNHPFIQYAPNVF